MARGGGQHGDGSDGGDELLGKRVQLHIVPLDVDVSGLTVSTAGSGRVGRLLVFALWRRGSALDCGRPESGERQTNAPKT